MGKFVDLTGQRFGKLTVLQRADNYVKPNNHTLEQWSNITGVASNTIRMRMDVYGWEIERALFYKAKKSE